MYRPHEFINAFILSQLSRLDQHNGVRKEFAAYLTEQLAQIPGVKGPTPRTMPTRSTSAMSSSSARKSLGSMFR